MGRIIVHSSGQPMHIGGRRRPVTRAKLAFEKYVLPGGLVDAQGMPLTAPEAQDWTGTPAEPALSQVYLNQKYGCCVPACAAHLKGIWTGYSGLVSGGQIFQDSQILDLYKTCSGGEFDPSNPQATDNGCDEVTAMGALVSTGFPVSPSDPPGIASKILGFGSVSVSNWANVCLAAWLFEGLMTGSELSDQALRNIPTQSGQTWSLAGQPNPNNGHCMTLGAFTNSSVKLVTWGKVFVVTRDDAQAEFDNANGGELHWMLSQDVIDRAKQKAPTALDFATLEKDMQNWQDATSL